MLGDDEDPDDLSIEALVTAVSQELLASQRNRLAAGGPAVFEVSEMNLEVSFVVTRSVKGAGGFDLKVVKADAGAQYDKQSVHKVSLRLTALRDQPQPFGGFGAVRPKRTEDG
ncbi:trypco2 family protein [Actinoplanes sp. CA-054009]